MKDIGSVQLPCRREDCLRLLVPIPLLVLTDKIGSESVTWFGWLGGWIWEKVEVVMKGIVVEVLEDWLVDRLRDSGKNERRHWSMYG